MPDPAPPSPPTVTQLLQASGGGEQAALDQMLPLDYAELRRQAERYLRRGLSDGAGRP